MFVFKFKLLDANMLGIIKKIENGFIVPPVKYNKKLSCKISIIKKLKDNFSDNCVFLKKNIKTKLLIDQKKTITFAKI